MAELEAGSTLSMGASALAQAAAGGHVGAGAGSIEGPATLAAGGEEGGGARGGGEGEESCSWMAAISATRMVTYAIVLDTSFSRWVSSPLVGRDGPGAAEGAAWDFSKASKRFRTLLSCFSLAEAVF